MAAVAWGGALAYSNSYGSRTTFRPFDAVAKDRSPVDGAGLANHVADDWPRDIVACAMQVISVAIATSIKRRVAKNVSKSPMREFVFPSESARRA
jgi:hypothetical protein